MDYKHVFNVVFSNYFLALLTPGQGGGGIAQLMFMKKAGVSVAKFNLDHHCQDRYVHFVSFPHCASCLLF